MKTMKFKVEKGPRGGQFYIDETGKKHYIKKTTKKYVERTVLTSANTINEKVKKTVPVQQPIVKRYTANYVVRDPESQEMIDDFNEWCDAYSKEEAMSEFKKRYPKIDDITIIKVKDIPND
jgi:hypothetical protein